MAPMTLQAAAWDEVAKPKSLPDGLYNKIADNQQLLQKVLKLGQAELEQAVKTFKDPNQLEQVLRAMVNRGFVITDANTEDITTFKQNLADAFQIGLNTGNVAPSASSSIVQITMVDSVMQLVTKMDTDLKKDLGKILADGYAQKKFPTEIVKEMSDKIGISQDRARKIATTETMRGSNTASWSQAKAEGAKYFIVDYRAAACKRCIQLFSGRIFDIDETKYIPPIHPWCACVPVYFDSKKDAEDYAKKIKKRNKLEKALLEKQGYKLPKDGTGPNATGKEQAKIIQQVEETTPSSSKTKNQSLTEKEKKTLQLYTEDGNKGTYEIINKYLRTGKVSENLLFTPKEMIPKIKESVKVLDGVIAKKQLTKDTVLWRGTGDQKLTFVKNGSYSDKGYMSTSKETFDLSTFTDTDTVLKINMPKGSTALDMSKTLNPGEAEVLLPRGMNFKMVKTGTVDSDWGVFKYIELVPV
jgi:SPP1 gp7 family putative phage head morphogenesis protein